VAVLKLLDVNFGRVATFAVRFGLTGGMGRLAVGRPAFGGAFELYEFLGGGRLLGRLFGGLGLDLGASLDSLFDR